MSELLASVVIAVRSDTRVRRLLESLRAQTIPTSRYEIIVVENGSRDLGDLARAGGLVRYLHNPEANSAAARNSGLATAQGRYLLLTDADCIPAADWVERITNALASTCAAAVGGTIRKRQPTTWVQRYAITIVDGQAKLNHLPALHLPYIVGANAGFRTDRLREVGGFDEDLRSGNDVDICYRLGLHGYTVTLEPAAVVWHEDRATVGAHFRRFRVYAIYQVLLFAKYKHVSGKRIIVDRYPFDRVMSALRDAPRAMLRLARRDPGPAARGLLQVVEAAGVFAGEIEGAIRFRQPYI